MFNPGAEAMLGRSAEEALGEVPDRFLPPDELTRQAGDLPSGATFVDICADVAASATPRRLWQLRAGCSRMGLTSIPLS